MTAAAIAQPLPEPAPTAAPPAQPPTPWLAQGMLDTVGRTGARIGMVWIGIVAFLAVFAPFLASSHPYLLKTDDPGLVRAYGRWSSPMLQNLNGSDVTLVALAIAAVVLWRNRSLKGSEKLILLFGTLFAAFPLLYWNPFLYYLSG